MKKLFFAICFLLSLTMFANAQQPGKKAPKKEAVAPAATTTGAATPLKKDGTPDKRFKANKTAPAAAGPLKKDGTPDKRYKANKKTK